MFHHQLPVIGQQNDCDLFFCSHCLVPCRDAHEYTLMNIYLAASRLLYDELQYLRLELLLYNAVAMLINPLLNLFMNDVDCLYFTSQKFIDVKR